MDKNLIMIKSDYQITVEKNGEGIIWFNGKRRITKDDPINGHKVGDIVNVKQWGTFGCWDDKNRWVDFYGSEKI